jgi:uncharacterized protein (DUF2062 family)
MTVRKVRSVTRLLLIVTERSAVKILQHRLWPQISAWLRDEASTEKLALSLALGLVLGVFPIFGVPTVLCGLAALVLRLNFPALQLVNYLAYPLQLALLWPFARLGGTLFGVSQHLRGVAGFSLIALRTTAAWFCFAVPACLILYFALRGLLRRHRARLA